MRHIIGIKYLFLSLKAEPELKGFGQEVYWLSTLRKRVRKSGGEREHVCRARPQLNFPRKICSSNYISSSHLEGCGGVASPTWELPFGKGKVSREECIFEFSHNTSSNESEVPFW